LVNSTNRSIFAKHHGTACQGIVIMGMPDPDARDIGD
jgi:hypothetical protein